ncbi:hypothetical protein BFO_0632 [Tannerella forsythia 92A2]|uniref:Uncharacterized protein n=1 Tax=Tannerella forsythia (strain ATCC 43037 / JCM 10827 / CCUG 21028 A / KCTC 5666 / FDC 338) TaxID=203275 RepID=G8UME9_TANFA|nr:hypothetical protein BFO_0632 [Tannerella forsythia 92A2]
MFIPIAFFLKDLALVLPYLCEASETKTTEATRRHIKKNVVSP